MGEYAKYLGREIKIGTCEEMYYLRHADRHRIAPLSGNVNPGDPATAAELRFRFPWPDEDHCGPGRYEAYGRAVPIHGAKAPDGVRHDAVQFTSQTGYLMSLPCPEGPDSTLPVHRNGFRGEVLLCQQKPTADGQTLRAILQCGGCGAKWRAETWADAEPLVVALRQEAGRFPPNDARITFWHAIADRLAEGYPEGRAGLVAVTGE